MDVAVANPFEVLGLRPSYALPLAEIEAAFRQKSLALHPDRFVNAPASARTQALAASRLLTDAYQVVRRPERRAQALLALWGVSISEHERMQSTFLMSMLEAREALDLLIAAGDQPGLVAAQAMMRGQRETRLAQLAAALPDAEPPMAPALAAIKMVLLELRYVDRYLEACDGALERLDDVQG